MILALLAIYYLAQSIVTFIIGIVKVMPLIMQSASSGDYPDIARVSQELMRAVGSQTPLILFVSVAITLPFYYLIYHQRKGELRTFVSLRGIGAVSIPMLVIFSISLNLLIEWLLSLASQFRFLAPFFERYEQLAQFITGGDFIPSLLAVGIVGPIFEELLFRGLIFGELRKVSKVRLALLIQAALFGVYHLDVIQGTYAFLIGILLGFVYYRSNSILAPIIVHITINASSVVLTQLFKGVELDQWTVVIVAAGALLFLAAGAFILMSRSFRRTMDNGLYHMNRAPVPEIPAADE